MTYIQPLLFCCLIGALTGLWMARRSKRKWIAVAGALPLVLISWPPVDWLLSRPLESEYPIRPFRPRGEIDAIVVLGSAVEPPHFERPYPLPDKDTFNRCEHAAWIYKQFGPRPVLACEGQQPRVKSGVMRELLRRGGVREDMIWLESESHSTRENALYGARILRLHGVKRIALIVEAQSMKRAAECFRKEGFDVAPAPSEFREFGPMIDEVFRSWTAIRRNEMALHEALGLVWYLLRGWI